MANPAQVGHFTGKFRIGDCGPLRPAKLTCHVDFEIATMNTTTTSESGTPDQPLKVLYTARAHTTGGREGGTSRTSDGRLDVHLTVPGGPGTGTNPEQLLAVGWSACFLSALKLTVAKQRLKLSADPAIDIEVDLRAADDGYSLRARFQVSLPGLEAQIARSVVDAAHQICPYSKATRGNISVDFTVV